MSCFYTTLIHPSFPSDFRETLWVGRDKVMFSDRNVVPGSTKDVDPRTCLTWQNHSDLNTPSYKKKKLAL